MSGAPRSRVHQDPRALASAAGNISLTNPAQSVQTRDEHVSHSAADSSASDFYVSIGIGVSAVVAAQNDSRIRGCPFCLVG